MIEKPHHVLAAAADRPGLGLAACGSEQAVVGRDENGSVGRVHAEAVDVAPTRRLERLAGSAFAAPAVQDRHFDRDYRRDGEHRRDEIAPQSAASLGGNAGVVAFLMLRSGLFRSHQLRSVVARTRLETAARRPAGEHAHTMSRTQLERVGGA